MNHKDELRDLLSKLKIDDGLDPPKLRSRLKRVLSRSHVDTTGGSAYATDEQRTKFEMASRAIELLDAPTKVRVPAVRREQSVLETSLATLIASNEAGRLASIEDRDIARVRDVESRATERIELSLQRHYRPAQFGGWTAGAIAALIAILDKPLGGLLDQFSEVGANVLMMRISLITFSLGGLGLGFAAQFAERRRSERLKWFLTDSGIRALLRESHLMTQIIGRDVTGNGSAIETLPIITVDSLATAITMEAYGADLATYEATAIAILAKLEQRGLATRVKASGISPAYQLSEAVISDLPSRNEFSLMSRSIIERIYGRRTFR